ncbi:MAG: thiamine diphosphokinase [Leptotrichiaceae bacterium]|nr:thiamine diphosphokinase [Leptotrichiaceae bacterium]
MKAIIFLNGEYSYEKRFLNEIIDEKDIIFCADGGANYTYKYNIYPNYIIGDLDSIDTIVLDFYKKEMVKIIKFDPEKNYTDFELILHEIERYQRENSIIFDNIYVFGGLGKRLDMTLNNINLLEEYQNLTFFSSNEEIFYKESSFCLKNKKGREISIISLDNLIEKLTLKGFKYEIEDINIERKTSRLVSNIVISNKCFINFEKGKIIVISRKI